MSKKDKKNQAEEPTENYQIESANEVQSEELHPVLVALLEKSRQDAKEGKGIPHEEVMKRIKEKYPFLK